MTHFKARNLTALLLVLILLVSMFSTTALAAEDEYITDFEAESEIIIEEEPAVELPEAEESSEEVSEIEESSEVSDAPTSGTIPDSNIQWELTDDGMLLISGSGGCAAFSSAADQPWAAVREQITSVFFEDPSLLSIYDLAYWFDGCVSLTTAEIPYTTPVIGTRAFYGCVSLTTIMTYYGDSVLAEIGADAFYLPYDSGSTLYIGYLIGYPESTVPLHTYDWTGSNHSSLYFMDVYSTNALTSVVGACPSCGKQSLQGTYVAQSHTSRGHAEYYECYLCHYTKYLGSYVYKNHGSGSYGSWTCPSCGSHSWVLDYESDATCTRNGYREYSCDCGQSKRETVYATGHNYSYGSWEQYSSSQHRRENYCRYCGATDYDYASHSYSYGSWGTHEDIAPYIDADARNNVILTQTEKLTMNNRPKDPKTARNKNVLVIGGSGSGKTRFWLKPNLMQCNSKTYPCSFVVTDPKGSVVVECGKMLRRFGYRIKIFNTINFKKSMHYNPFAYIHSEKDILKLVTCLISNTKGDGKTGDEFWQKAETLLYCALIGYIHYEAPVEEQNFATLIEMLNSMEVREDDEEFENAVDLMFKELSKEKPDHFAVRQYAKYRLAAGKTLKSILVSCGARLAPFDIEELREVTAYDELELDTLGDRKTALFLIMSDTDASFNFLISMIYSQLFNLLCEKADDVYGGRLPVHVRCLIDEAANIGQIPQLEKLVATIRSREISACLILQAQSQLKALYKDNADTIIGNMDSRLFLGGSEPTTLKELSTALGKETIDTFNTGESRGRETSHSLNYQKLGKELASVDELAVLDGGKCILQLRGVRPFLSEKYDITKHPNYKYLSDADRRNTFDIEKFLSTKLKVKPEETYDSYEVAVTEELSSV